MAMSRMTFTVPEQTKLRAQAMQDVNWSAVVAQAIEKRIQAMDALEAFAKKSKLTQQDVDEISNSINKSMARHYRRRFAGSS